MPPKKVTDIHPADLLSRAKRSTKKRPAAAISADYKAVQSERRVRLYKGKKTRPPAHLGGTSLLERI
eukprot:2541059-Heterocapsa_arctica.AAC.1